MRKTVHYSGNVQGVGFRATTRDIARRFAVTGTVQNLPSGQVRVVVEGEAKEVAAFLGEVATEMSRKIDNQNVVESADTGEFSDFQIVY